MTCTRHTNSKQALGDHTDRSLRGVCPTRGSICIEPTTRSAKSRTETMILVSICWFMVLIFGLRFFFFDDVKHETFLFKVYNKKMRAFFPAWRTIRDCQFPYFSCMLRWLKKQSFSIPDESKLKNIHPQLTKKNCPRLDTDHDKTIKTVIEYSLRLTIYVDLLQTVVVSWY